MTLREQFEKHRNVMRPCEPYIESENPEQWVRVLEWQEEYSDWLETKLQTPSNSDYEKCSHVIGLICGVLDITISECDELNLHEIYHKIVEIKNVVKELSQHFA